MGQSRTSYRQSPGDDAIRMAALADAAERVLACLCESPFDRATRVHPRLYDITLLWPALQTYWGFLASYKRLTRAAAAQRRLLRQTEGRKAMERYGSAPLAHEARFFRAMLWFASVLSIGVLRWVRCSCLPVKEMEIRDENEMAIHDTMTRLGLPPILAPVFTDGEPSLQPGVFLEKWGDALDALMNHRARPWPWPAEADFLSWLAALPFWATLETTTQMRRLAQLEYGRIRQERNAARLDHARVGAGVEGETGDTVLLEDVLASARPSPEDALLQKEEHRVTQGMLLLALTRLREDKAALYRRLDASLRRKPAQSVKLLIDALARGYRGQNRKDKSLRQFALSRRVDYDSWRKHIQRLRNVPETRRLVEEAERIGCAIHRLRQAATT